MGRKTIGVGKELAFRGFARVSERRHDLRVGPTAQRVRYLWMLREAGEEIGERRSLDNGELLENHSTLFQKVENLRRAGTGRDLVGAGPDPRLPSLHPQVP